jgi:hypothetical protein
MTAPKSSSIHLLRAGLRPRIGRATVYEISRLERVVQILGKGLLDQAVLAVDDGDHRRAVLLHYFYY